MVFKKDVNPFIVSDERFLPKYVLAIMASKLLSFFYVNLSSIATKDDFRQTTLTELRRLPIVLINIEEQNVFVNLVTRILAAKQADSAADTRALEAEIDRLVYALYGLTEAEIKIVEGGNG
jgi:hypothetical protein